MAKKYQQTQAAYAKMYGKSLPTIKRWCKKGLPLDDPDAMGVYISPKGRKAEDDFREDPPRSKEPLPGELEDALADAEARLLEMPAARMEGEGLQAAIQRICAFEVQTAKLVRDAIVRRRPQEIRYMLDCHAIALEQMRKLEKDTPGILSRNASQVAISDVEAKVGVLILAFCQALDALPARAAGKLDGLDFNDRLDLLKRECDLVKRTLEKCEYLGAPPLPAHG